MTTVHTTAPVFVDRIMSPRAVTPMIEAMEASGVVDSFLSGDQLTSFCPRALWTPNNVPMAEYIPDPDSASDAFVIASFGAAASTRLGVAVTTDSVRRGPAELVQAMLTLAHATEGDATLMLGAGELKQLHPFGYKRSQGLDRMEDIMRAWNALLEADEPIDLEGNVWNLRGAWLGTGRPFRPKIWAMGGGKRLIDIAVRHGDGYTSALPQAYFRPEQYAEAVAGIKRDLEVLGRDPEAFGFGLFVQAVLHEDRSVIDQGLDNDVLKFFAATSGRLNQSDWDAEGIEPVMPRDYHYSLHLLPAVMEPEEAVAIANRVSPEMVTKSYAVGTPAEVADQLVDYVEAGANQITIIDMLPLVLPPDQAMLAGQHTLDCCRHLKEAASR